MHMYIVSYKINLIKRTRKFVFILLRRFDNSRTMILLKEIILPSFLNICFWNKSKLTFFTLKRHRNDQTAGMVFVYAQFNTV